MARKVYTRSDETFKALSGHEAATAREMECDPSYIYKLKNGDERDPYPPFRQLFRSNSNAGGLADYWLNDLIAIRMQKIAARGRPSELVKKLLEKNQTDADALGKLIESVADGQLDEAECHTILGAMAKTQEINERIRTLVLVRLGELGEGKPR